MLSLGKRLKYLRNKKNMTQQQVADSLSIQRATYNYFENDRRLPDIPTLIQICDLFNASADFLLGLSNSISSDNLNEKNDLHVFISTSDNLLFDDIKIENKDRDVVIKTLQNTIDILLMMQKSE